MVQFTFCLSERKRVLLVQQHKKGVGLSIYQNNQVDSENLIIEQEIFILCIMFDKLMDIS